MSFMLRAGPFDTEALKRELFGPAAGACVTFEGWVRNENEGREVLRLQYESYEAMAVKEGGRIIDEAREKFPLINAICVHRVGLLEIGDIAVWVGASSAHRGEAFDACRYIIDEIKHRTPIWKKEFYVDGDSCWVRCEACAAPGHTH